MAPEYDRDSWLAHLVRRHSVGRPVPPGGCLDAETLAAWFDGGLTPAERAAAEAHAADCSRCLALIAAAERTAPPDTVQPSQRGWIRWAVPLAAAATAVAIWVAIPEQRVPRTASDDAFQVAPQMSSAPRVREEAGSALPGAPVDAPPVTVVPPTPNRQTQAKAPESLPQAAPSARVGEPSGLKREMSVPPAARAPAASSSEALNETVSTFTQREDDASSRMLEARVQDESIRWRVVTGTLVERSVDGGVTWMRTTSPIDKGPQNSPAVTLVSIRATNALEASVTTSDGRTFATEDGGATWSLR